MLTLCSNPPSDPGGAGGAGAGGGGGEHLAPGGGLPQGCRLSQDQAQKGIEHTSLVLRLRS